MKKRTVFIVLVILFASAAAVAWNMIFKDAVSVSVPGSYTAVKVFPFQSVNDINEWEEKALSRYHTEYQVEDFEGRTCLKAASENSASALYYKLDLSYKKRPSVFWEWIVEEFPKKSEKETLGKKKEFDFAAQVYVVFHSRFFLNAKAIQYVWANDLPVGMVADSPYTPNVKILVLESGPSDEWKREERDIAKDFKDLFGEDLDKNVDAVAFMTDADSTKTSAVARYDDIALGFLGAATPATENSTSMSAARFGWLSKFSFFKKGKKEEPSNI